MVGPRFDRATGDASRRRSCVAPPTQDAPTTCGRRPSRLHVRRVRNAADRPARGWTGPPWDTRSGGSRVLNNSASSALPGSTPSSSGWRSAGSDGRSARAAGPVHGSRRRAATVDAVGNFAGTQCRPLVDRWAPRPATIPSPPLSLLRGTTLSAPTNNPVDASHDAVPAAPFDLPVGSTAVVYCEGQFGEQDGKTGNGLVRHSEKYEILSVIDSTVRRRRRRGSSSTGSRTASPSSPRWPRPSPTPGRSPTT